MFGVRIFILPFVRVETFASTTNLTIFVFLPVFIQ